MQLPPAYVKLFLLGYVYLYLSVVSVLALRTSTGLLSRLFLFMYLLRTLIAHFVWKHLKYGATRNIVIMNMLKMRGRQPGNKEYG
jgi:hypothetical protein